MAFDGENLQAGTLNRQPQDNTAIVLTSSYLLGSCIEKANFPAPASTIGVPLRLPVRRWYSEVSATRPQLY